MFLDFPKGTKQRQGSEHANWAGPPGIASRVVTVSCAES
jgi:hypothetical protein